MNLFTVLSYKQESQSISEQLNKNSFFFELKSSLFQLVFSHAKSNRPAIPFTDTHLRKHYCVKVFIWLNS